ncbi:MAG: nucleotide sugar dehydrogenase [Thermodesulfobacteriota bacterium]
MQSAEPKNLTRLIESREARLAVIGLGYVGLPLAVEFGKQFPVTGFDSDPGRLAELRAGTDRTREVDAAVLKAARHLVYSENPEDLPGTDIFIVTVPTPVDGYKRPDLTALIRASETVGRALKPGALVIYESTVYPGCTEEDCVPVLARLSGLVFNRDFFCGYSPERINPGDRIHSLTQIRKVTSGSTPGAADAVDSLYRAIIAAGTHRAPSLRVAEAAKVIENAQRDINIAFVNELAMIFDCLGIDTQDVLEAAATKWNFLPFRPGLVGGHCIGVDPYYLAQKAQSAGYHPEILLAGRRLNDNMGRYVAGRVIKLMIQRGQTVRGSKVLVLGVTFKENCPDIRNSRVIDVIRELQAYGCLVTVHDPWADADEVRRVYGLELAAGFRTDGMDSMDAKDSMDAVVLAVAHDVFKGLDMARFRKPGTVVFDIKAFLAREGVDGRL